MLIQREGRFDKFHWSFCWRFTFSFFEGRLSTAAIWNQELTSKSFSSFSLMMFLNFFLKPTVDLKRTRIFKVFLLIFMFFSTISVLITRKKMVTWLMILFFKIVFFFYIDWHFSGLKEIELFKSSWKLYNNQK